MDDPDVAVGETVVCAQLVLPRLCCFVWVWDPACGCVGKNHPVLEHNGYTNYHLPGVNCRPALDSRVEANVASLAARMAFSSFEIRSPLR